MMRIRKELINDELCAQCTPNCCEIYGGEHYNTPEYDIEIIKRKFHSRPKGDWRTIAYDRYGVYPLHDPLFSNSTFCEFHDPSIGCIIDRERRPIRCRVYSCPKLKQNFIIQNEIQITESQTIRPIGYEMDNSLNKIMPIFDPEIPDKSEDRILERLNMCSQCSNYMLLNDRYLCKACGCGLIRKIALYYPLDHDGKSVDYVLSNGTYRYVCPERKW